MRPQTLHKIDACHAEIERLIKMELAYVLRTDPPRNNLWRSVREAQLAMHRLCPNDRAQMVEATASFATLGMGRAADGGAKP